MIFKLFPKGLLETGVALLVWEAAKVNLFKALCLFVMQMLLRLYQLLVDAAVIFLLLCANTSTCLFKSKGPYWAQVNGPNHFNLYYMCLYCSYRTTRF